MRAIPVAARQSASETLAADTKHRKSCVSLSFLASLRAGRYARERERLIDWLIDCIAWRVCSQLHSYCYRASFAAAAAQFRWTSFRSQKQFLITHAAAKEVTTNIRSVVWRNRWWRWGFAALETLHVETSAGATTVGRQQSRQVYAVCLHTPWYGGDGWMWVEFVQPTDPTEFLSPAIYVWRVSWSKQGLQVRTCQLNCMRQRLITRVELVNP